MSPRTGRPTTDPKRSNMNIRFSEKDLEKLDYCAKVLGLTKAEVIRRGIDKMYDEALKKEKEQPLFPAKDEATTQRQTDFSICDYYIQDKDFCQFSKLKGVFYYEQNN